MILKRFWKLIALCLVIITILVTYFIHTSLVVANQFPDLVLKTIVGDESVMTDVVVTGDYHDTRQNDSSSVMVSLKDSIYHKEQSFFEKLETQFPMINTVSKLKDEYRNFLRSKSMHPDYFFENNEFVAYVDVETPDNIIRGDSEFYFNVDVLTKKTEKSNDFTIKIPGQSEMDYTQVIDVQMVNGELKVLTESSFFGSNGRHINELMVYTIDLSKQKISGDDTLSVKGDLTSDTWTSFIFLNDRSDVSEQKYFLLQREENSKPEEVSKQEGLNEVEEAEIKVIKRSFYLYDLENKGLREIPLNEEQAKGLLKSDTWGFVSGENAYIAYNSEDSLTVLDIDLEHLKVESTARFNIEDLGIDTIGDVKISDNTIYVIDNYKDNVDPTNVFAGDVTSGEVLYEGEIVMEKPEDESEDYQINFYGIVMK